MCRYNGAQHLILVMPTILLLGKLGFCATTGSGMVKLQNVWQVSDCIYVLTLMLVLRILSEVGISLTARRMWEGLLKQRLHAVIVIILETVFCLCNFHSACVLSNYVKQLLPRSLVHFSV